MVSRWAITLPPSRPSAGHLAVFRAALSRVTRDHPVAVLGSTPEFCDLLVQAGFRKVFVFEKSKEFYEAAQRLRAYPHACTPVWGDWIDTLAHYNGEFGAVLSDLTSGNVPYECRADFYENLATALRPDGLFIDKQLRHHLPLNSPDVILARYSTQPLNLITANRFNCEALFCSSILDPVDGILDLTKAYALLEARVANDPHLHALVQLTEQITPRSGQWFYGRPWDELERDYDRFLLPVAEFDDDVCSPYFGHLKIAVSSKRGNANG